MVTTSEQLCQVQLQENFELRQCLRNLTVDSVLFEKNCVLVQNVIPVDCGNKTSYLCLKKHEYHFYSQGNYDCRRLLIFSQLSDILLYNYNSNYLARFSLTNLNISNRNSIRPRKMTMSSYIPVLQSLLLQNYPEQCRSGIVTLAISHIPFQKIMPPTSHYLTTNFPSLTTLIITNCDLRTLENLPYLPKLVDIDVSKNSLQGSFEHLVMRNRIGTEKRLRANDPNYYPALSSNDQGQKMYSLEYVNASNNQISRVEALAPLRRIKGIQIFLSDNEVCEKQGFSSKLKSWHIKLLKQEKSIAKPARVEASKKENEESKVNSSRKGEKDSLQIREKRQELQQEGAKKCKQRLADQERHRRYRMFNGVSCMPPPIKNIDLERQQERVIHKYRERRAEQRQQRESQRESQRQPQRQRQKQRQQQSRQINSSLGIQPSTNYSRQFGLARLPMFLSPEANLSFRNPSQNLLLMSPSQFPPRVRDPSSSIANPGTQVQSQINANSNGNPSSNLIRRSILFSSDDSDSLAPLNPITNRNNLSWNLNENAANSIAPINSSLSTNARQQQPRQLPQQEQDEEQSLNDESQNNSDEDQNDDDDDDDENENDENQFGFDIQDDLDEDIDMDLIGLEMDPNMDLDDEDGDENDNDEDDEEEQPVDSNREERLQQNRENNRFFSHWSRSSEAQAADQAGNRRSTNNTNSLISRSITRRGQRQGQQDRRQYQPFSNSSNSQPPLMLVRKSSMHFDVDGLEDLSEISENGGENDQLDIEDQQNQQGRQYFQEQDNEQHLINPSNSNSQNNESVSFQKILERQGQAQLKQLMNQICRQPIRPAEQRKQPELQQEMNRNSRNSIPEAGNTVSRAGEREIIDPTAENGRIERTRDRGYRAIRRDNNQSQKR